MLKNDDVHRQDVLQDLHNDIWREELLGYLFSYVHDIVLYPVEREVVQLKVDGLSKEQIATLLGIKPKTVQDYISEIRYCYRNQMHRKPYNILGVRRANGYYGKKGRR